MSNFKLQVLSPAKPIANVAASGLTVPGGLGYLEVLPGHAPFVSTIDVGTLEVKKSQGENLRYFVAGGYVKVLADDVVVLADVIEVASEIDRERAERAEKRASERLLAKEDIDLGRALSAQKRARGRLEFLSQ